ncbi:hypothetical protein AD945_01315 [Gluconobacter albidus]|uniref:Putative endonuclease SegE-like GIY-YIG domain-containing protein n=1 Tax=Gluconobacter albidus TaxID=318683 RepID=A0A149TN38_9PROT|nr:hypothetical protein [Gluconobacter albidus]KXV50768.1 hypothetical protein AD945_01315 [Gluconobacter albidus]
MDWKHGNTLYAPGTEVAIVYKMTFNGYWYIGKKQIVSSSGKTTNWKSYYGSGKRWLKHIEGNEALVSREVLYLCANKVESTYYENYELYSRHAIFQEKSLNDNVAMTANRRNTKNFKNKPETL